MTAHLTATSGAYATTTGGATSIASTTTYTFSPSGYQSNFEMWTGNDTCGYIHWGNTLVSGGWAGRFLKYQQTSVSVGFASKSATVDIASGTNTFRFSFNGGINQMTLSVSSGSTTWNQRYQSDLRHSPG
jgi:hypothetical protein